MRAALVGAPTYSVLFPDIITTLTRNKYRPLYNKKPEYLQSLGYAVGAYCLPSIINSGKFDLQLFLNFVTILPINRPQTIGTNTMNLSSSRGDDSTIARYSIDIY